LRASVLKEISLSTSMTSTGDGLICILAFVCLVGSLKLLYE